MDSETQYPKHKSPRSAQFWGAFSGNQWVMLSLLAGVLLAIGAMFALVLRAGTAMPVGMQPTVTPDESVAHLLARPRDAVSKTEGLYWPPHAMPLATPNAPGDLIWWDARFAYRRPVHLDVLAAQAPTGTWARVILDGEHAQSKGRMRADMADVRLLLWNGQQWWEIPRQVRSLDETDGWELVFQLQGIEFSATDQGGKSGYHVYYGHPFAEQPPLLETVPETRALLLELGDEERVEWGPEVIWSADAKTTQTVVSPDGRIVIECQPGTVQVDTRVRVRTVPLSEKRGYGPLPDFELHAEPPPDLARPSNVVRWRPSLAVTINWVGLAVDPEDLESWTHFVYDTSKGRWFGVPGDFDPDRGVIRITTDQL
jgi:hypothetical protein